MGAAVLATGKPVVTVLIHGRVVTFGEGHNSKFGDDNALLTANPKHAVVSTGRPGEEGGNAVFDVLTGIVQPGGRLAQPWPRGVGYVHSRTVPYYNLHQGDYDWGNTFPAARTPDKPWALVDGNWAPLFCFGHGL